MAFYAWLTASFVLSFAVAVLLMTGAAERWLFLADAALLLALVGAFRAWRSRP